jgi:hypothetical protein
MMSELVKVRSRLHPLRLALLLVGARRASFALCEREEARCSCICWLLLLCFPTDDV